VATIGVAARHVGLARSLSHETPSTRATGRIVVLVGQIGAGQGRFTGGLPRFVTPVVAAV